MNLRVWKSAFTAAVGLALLLPLAGCGRDSNSKKKVVATTTMIGDLVRHVADDTVELETLMGPGVDPHIYEAKGSDTRKMNQADLVLYNGLHLEGTLAHILEENPKAKAVARDIPSSRLLTDSNQPDPHVWFDVSLWVIALDTVEKDLIELNPGEADRYRKNAARYRDRLKELHEEVKKDIAVIPEEQRVFVTAHDAFRYFGRAYGIQVEGIQGVSTGDQASLERINRIADLMVDRKVKAIFAESSVSDQGVKAVLKRCEARGHKVAIPDETLFSDAMGEPDGEGGTYPKMIRHNVRLIVKYLK